MGACGNIPFIGLPIAHRQYITRLRYAMLRAARDWAGTPYLLGGNSCQGIDCSHLVGYWATRTGRRFLRFVHCV
jgi:hypothetical protein